MKQTLLPDLAVSIEPNWSAYQGLAMRLRALFDAAHAHEPNARLNRSRRAEAVLKSLEAEIDHHTNRLAEDLLYGWLERRPKKPGAKAVPAGEIPDLLGLA